MKKTKLFFVGAAILIGGGTAVHAQSWRNDGAVSLDKQYADYPCVNLLDSTSVTVEPTGQGSFAVCRAVRVQTTAGALQQRILKYDYDPLTAAATFKRVTIYHADGTYTSVDVTKAVTTPLRPELSTGEPARLCWNWVHCNRATSSTMKSTRRIHVCPAE